MAAFDVIQVDDEDDLIELMEIASVSRGLSYRGVTSLEALDSLLAQDSAQVFVVDGSFLRYEKYQQLTRMQKDQLIEPLSQEAIEMIKARGNGYKRIILYSALDNCENTARVNGVKFVNKGNLSGLRLLDLIKEELAGEPEQQQQSRPVQTRPGPLHLTHNPIYGTPYVPVK